MKLIIQIPCYNEEANLAIALEALPRQVEGINTVEWLIIDDGSSDSTIEVAKRCGVEHIISFPKNQGLARAFEAGLEECIQLGADVIVNTDADNQYQAADIPKLIAPILNNQAEIVIGTRPIQSIEHFSPAKKFLQKLGSWFIRLASNTDVPDAPSGFRALSRKAAQQINVFNDYTYTHEMIIQAGQKNMAISSVDISVNAELRPSRLFCSTSDYIRKSIVTAIRAFITYRPLRFFTTLGIAFLLAGFLVGLRFIFFYVNGTGDGHVQSLILVAILSIVGFQILIVGVVADLISVNRKLLEKMDRRLTAVTDRNFSSHVLHDDNKSQKAA